MSDQQGPAARGAESRMMQRADGGEESVFDLREILGTLRRNAWIILLVGALSAGGTYYLLSKELPQFQASSLVRLRDVKSEVGGGMVGDAQQGGGVIKADPVQSELLVLRGRQVGGAVVDREGLRLFDLALGAPSPLVTDQVVTLPAERSAQLTLSFGSSDVTAELAGRAVRAPYGQPLELDGVRLTVPEPPAVPQLQLTVLPRETAVDWLLGATSARPREGTDAIMVQAATTDPRLTVRVVNALAEEYREANAASARELTRRRREFLEERLRETDEELVEAQTALGRFRNRAEVYNSREQYAAERAGITEVEMRRKELEAERRSYRALLAEMERAERPSASAAFRTLLASPGMASNPVVASLHGRLMSLETTRDSLATVGRPRTHADVQQVLNLISTTETRLLEAMRVQISSLDTRIAALGDVRQMGAAEIKRLSPAETEEVRLTQQVEALRGVSVQLREELQRARLADAIEMGQVEIVDVATRATMLPPNHVMKLGLGLAFGLFLGAAIGFLREHLGSGLNRRSDVERALRVPGLVVIPRLDGVKPRRRKKPGKQKKGMGLGTSARRNGAAEVATGEELAKRALPELVTISDSREAGADAYRALRTRLLFAQSDRPLRSLVVTSADVEEGKTTTASNLAVALAQQGLRVLLVDCDLRRPRVHSVFGMPNGAGLCELLMQQVDPELAMRRVGVGELRVLTSGAVPEGPLGPAELLGGTRMATFVEWAAERFDMVVMDTPPVLVAPDAPILSARADGALLVLRAGRTGRAQAQDAVHQLTAVGARVVGAVLNDPDARTSSYNEYSYRYGYYAHG
ncbi:MAG TPA: polysaccharide biosynthesis tyrosine autokinase [Gemmatimonadales bacterium]